MLATLAGATADGRVARTAWERRSIGYGAHGERVYDWTVVALDPAGLPDGWGHWLLIRQQTTLTEGKTVVERAYYRCAGPESTPLRELIRVAGARWAIEECFQTAKNEARARPLPGPHLQGLVRPHHPGDARRRLARRHPRPRTPA